MSTHDKWEYKFYQLTAMPPPGAPTLQDELNSLGNQGWEVCDIKRGVGGWSAYLLKRLTWDIGGGWRDAN